MSVTRTASSATAPRARALAERAGRAPTPRRCGGAKAGYGEPMRSFLAASLTAAAIAAVLVACSSDDPPASPAPKADAGSTPDAEPIPENDAGGGGDAAKGPNPTVTNESVSVGGKTRTFVLVVPETYSAAKKYPLVLAFHGDGGTAASFRAYYKFDTYSGEDAVVAYLDGLGQTWDIERLAPNPDVDFAMATVDAIKAKVSVDAARVFATGWSSGGFFVNRLACMKSTSIRGLSSHAGGAVYESDANKPHPTYPNGFPKCPGQDKVPAFITHGLSDPAVEPASGDFDASYWAYVNGCQDNRAATSPSPCVAHAGCPAGKPVVYCPIPGNGHGIWKEGAKESWAFFKSLP